MISDSSTQLDDVEVEWPKSITRNQIIFLLLFPVISVLLIIFWLRILWYPVDFSGHSEESNRQSITCASENEREYNQTYGSIESQSTPSHDVTQAVETVERHTKRSRHKKLAPGEIAGDYRGDWISSFDIIFLIGMALYLLVLLILTSYNEDKIFYNKKFWTLRFSETFVMMLVSTLGGLVCRYFCDVDDLGYIITEKNSVFKVNYTRKIQHFCAYLVPLLIPSGTKDENKTILELAWGEFFTLLGFLIMIKPLRESIPCFMLQFNSLDRPEDRPRTLKWIIAGNIVPGFIILLFFKWTLSKTDADELTYTIVLVTSIGDGLAEPIGVTYGVHRYTSKAFMSSRRYVRSLEGSACVFISGMVFPAIQYAQFQSFEQVVLTMLLLPPIAAVAEATAPHSCDTPALMFCCGFLLYLISRIKSLS